jgi:hypothetical protein
MKCKLCGQRNVDGAFDQFGDFVCVDCFAEGNAHFSGRQAQVMAPAPLFGSTSYAKRLNHKNMLDAWNGNKEAK